MIRPRLRTIVGVIAVVAVVGGLTALVVMRLTRPGEPGFIRATEPSGAHRLWSSHTGGGYFSRPTTIAVIYGSDQPFSDVAGHYRDALTAAGFTLRHPLTTDETLAQLVNNITHECLDIDSTVSRPTMDKLSPGASSYALEYAVSYQRGCHE